MPSPYTVTGTDDHVYEVALADAVDLAGPFVTFVLGDAIVFAIATGAVKTIAQGQVTAGTTG